MRAKSCLFLKEKSGQLEADRKQPTILVGH